MSVGICRDGENYELRIMNYVSPKSLRLIIRQVPPNSEILVPPGEYEGPFVFNQAVRLLGQGEYPEAVTLWTRRGPAIIVQSPGVVLSNVNVELTEIKNYELRIRNEEGIMKEETLNSQFLIRNSLRNSQFVIWYAVGCRPDVRGAKIQGEEEQMGVSQQDGHWHLPNLIDCGDLQAHYLVRFPMVIQVPGPAHLHEELAGLQVTPSQIGAAGQHLIHIEIPSDKLSKDTMLAGQLVIESLGERRTIWVIGRVTDFSGLVYDKIILIGQSGRKFGFGTSMALGNAQLQGEPGADKVADKQAYILKEASGVWSIIQPLPVSNPTKVAGKLLDIGHRCVLKANDIIEIGKLKLTVETKQTDLPLTVNDNVDFGKLSGRLAMSQVITIQSKRGAKSWTGTLRSTVPWIEIPQPNVTCASGQTVQLPVKLGRDTRSLPRQLVNYTGALVLAGGKESWGINARLDVDVEEELTVELEISPQVLDWGNVGDWQQAAPQTIRLRNIGQKDWHGKAESRVRWLEVIPLPSGVLDCPAQKEIYLTVRLTNKFESLSSGQLESPAAISIYDMLGQGGKTWDIAARLMVQTAQIMPHPLVLDLTLADRINLPHQSLRLKNVGNQAWQGAVKSSLPWLTIQPDKVTCPADGEVTVEVKVNSQANVIFDKPRSPVQIRDAIWLEGPGQSILVGVNLEVVARDFRLPILDFGLAENPQTKIQNQKSKIKNSLDFGWVSTQTSPLPTKEIRLTNSRPWPIDGRAYSTVPWLEVVPARFSQPPGQETVLTAQLTQVAPQLRPRIYDVPEAIVIESGAEKTTIRVRIQIGTGSGFGERAGGNNDFGLKDDDNPKSKIQNPKSVDFGTVSLWSKSWPTREVRLPNKSSREIRGTVRSTVPWLEVTPTEFSCLSGQTVTFTTQLTKGIISLRPKIYDVVDALVIQWGTEKQFVRVQLGITN